MFIFWIVLILISILSIFFIMLILSTIQIEISKLNFDSSKLKSKRLQEYLFIIKLKLFNKITWIKLKINKTKINKAKNSKFYKKVVLNKIKNIKGMQDLKVENIKVLKELEIKIDKLNLFFEFCIENSAVTAFSTVIISTLISVILSIFANGYKKEKYEYKIKPIFGKQNFLKICIDCIISLKMVHIINVIYILKKKRSVNKYDKRTSDRRTYAYSNE